MDAAGHESTQKTREVDELPLQLLTFHVGDQIHAVEVGKVREIVRYREPEFRPGEPPWLLGVIQLRGEILPVIDARTRLGLPSKSPDATAIYVILEGNGRHLALLVDDVLDVAQVEPNALEGLLPELAGSAAVFRGFVRLDERTVAVLDPEAFCPLAEKGR